MHKTLKTNNKQLDVLAHSFQGDEIHKSLFQVIEDEFKAIVPFLKDKEQVMYMRDIKHLAINDELPGGSCYNRHELFVSVPSWNVDMNKIKATVAHELHHLAMWQNNASWGTLGDSIFLEGLACMYEEQRTGLTPPYANATITKKDIEDAKKEWNSSSYDHHEWFFKSKRGKWVGYTIGYKLLSLHFKDSFNTETSISMKPEDISPLLDKVSI